MERARRRRGRRRLRHHRAPRLLGGPGRLVHVGPRQPPALLRGVAEILSREMGGSSGPLWTIGLFRAAGSLDADPGVGPALAAAAAGISEYGGAKEGDKTFLDALLAAASAVSALPDGAPAAEVAQAAAEGAWAGAARTAGYAARRGRAAYVGDRAVGRFDPGAAAVAMMFGAVAEAYGSPVRPPASYSASRVELARPGAAEPAGTKQFVNDPDDAVTESLVGYALAHPDLVVWEPGDRFLRRRQPSPGLVGLVAGGGSGHEPMHGGFVGTGMLTAVAPGPVFASPTVHQVLAATLAADAGAGVVHLVKNYTGDLINFGIAAELAQARGVVVRRVVIADDIGVDSSRHDVGRRGTGATVLAEKVAGAAAQAGRPIGEVVAVTERLLRGARSFGIALGSCSPPGAAPILALGADEIEMGVGIHGEPGRERAPYRPAADLVRMAAGELLASLAPPPGASLLALASGLGGTTLMEQYLLFGELHARLTAAGHRVARSLVGPYLTALDMAGAVLTVAVLDEELTALWDAPVAAAGLRWGA
ncbi:dihydroxyacetone kinase subunit DhaK [Phytohabitans flavus]|uniref:dihydroxyacetone kinase subunit DhaK n=1 Tax=Phytohabitans flavus TaxID=1076124 RepID=UPI003638A2A9